MLKPQLCTDSLGRVFFRCELLDENCIKTTWSGNMIEPAPAQKAAKLVVEFLQNSMATKILDDNRMGMGDWPDIEDWMRKTWIPQLIAAGLKSYAHVLSPDLHAKEPAKRLFNQTHDGADFVTFDSFTSAVNWLQSQPTRN